MGLIFELSRCFSLLFKKLKRLPDTKARMLKRPSESHARADVNTWF